MKRAILIIMIFATTVSWGQPKIGCPPCQPDVIDLEKGHQKLIKLGEKLIKRYKIAWMKITGKKSHFKDFTDIYLTLSYLHLKNIQNKTDHHDETHSPLNCRIQDVHNEKVRVLLKELLTPEIRKETEEFLKELERTMLFRISPENKIMIEKTREILNYPDYK